MGLHVCRRGIQTVVRMVFASLFSLLMILMAVFVVASFDVGFCGACFASFGPCMAHENGHVLSCLLAFRNAGSVGAIQNASSAVDPEDSACRRGAPRFSPPCSASSSPRPHHLGGGGRTIALVPPIWRSGQGNPTLFMVGQNGKFSFGGVHVPRELGSTCTPGFSIRPVSPNFWTGETRDLGSTCTPGFSIGPVWSPNFWAGVSRLFSSRSGSASSSLRGGGDGRRRARSLDEDLRVGEV
jgi:hypothetical protein